MARMAHWFFGIGFVLTIIQLYVKYQHMVTEDKLLQEWLLVTCFWLTGIFIGIGISLKKIENRAKANAKKNVNII